jgi:hypothetical protein
MNNVSSTRFPPILYLITKSNPISLYSLLNRCNFMIPQMFETLQLFFLASAFWKWRHL